MAAISMSKLFFVDEDDFPVAFLHMVHEDSVNEAPLNVTCSDSEISSYESGDESDDSEGNPDQDYLNLQWFSCIQAPSDVNFNDEFGVKVNLADNSNSLNF